MKENNGEIINNFLRLISQHDPTHIEFAKKSVLVLSEQERSEFEQVIKFYVSNGKTFDEVYECYRLIIKDALKQGIHFAKTGKYKYSNFNEIYHLVYSNAAYMERYMIGLSITSFLWLNHVMLARFFASILPKLNDRNGNYLEVGPGHGIFFKKVINSGKFSNAVALDVSETSLELTRDIIDIGKKTCEVEFLHADFLTYRFSNINFNTVVIGEVLEHVEEPSEFIKQATNLLAYNGTLFISTCINAPAIDHLYNWDSIVDLEDDLTRFGLKVEDRLLLPTAGLSVEQCEAQRKTINVGYLLRK